MASVYILYSLTADLHYIGSTKDTIQRLDYHKNKEFPKSFTAKYSDWDLYYSIDDISITIARKIEFHIKRMKNRSYLQNMKKYPEIAQKLIAKYS